MLILERRVGESLTIDNDVEVIVLSSQGNKIRLGVNAPKHKPIHRTEIQKQREVTPCLPQD